MAVVGAVDREWRAAIEGCNHVATQFTAQLKAKFLHRLRTCVLKLRRLKDVEPTDQFLCVEGDGHKTTLAKLFQQLTQLRDGADSKLLGGISRAFAFYHQPRKAFSGIGLLLMGVIKPCTKRQGAVVLALDSSVRCPKIPTVKGGAWWDAFAWNYFIEVVPHETLKR
jgi:hypothetical protein